jgi:MFS family permease
VSNAALPASRRLRDRLPFDADALLTRHVRRFFVGTLFGAVGTGLILPFFVIYCVDVRHFSAFTAAALLAWEALLGVSIAPVYGTLIDRHGPSRILTITMPLGALGVAGIAFASSPAQMLVVATFFAVIGAGMWSAFSTLVTRLVVEEHRADAFGLNFMLLNLGIGIGVLLGGLIANVHELRSFQLLYLLAASLMLVNWALWFTLRKVGGPLPQAVQEATADQGWREVIRDHRLVRFVLCSLVMMACGYGSMEAGLPLFITRFAHLGTRVVSLVFVFNTVTIVVFQIVSLGAIRGRSRSLILGVVGACWGVSWLFATASVYVGVVAAVVALCLGQVIFATGETLFQPVSQPLVNDLAPEHLRGRYNSLVGVIWGVSGAVGQLIAGAFLGAGLGVEWSIFVAIGAVAGGLGLTTMRRVLTPAEDGRVLPSAAPDSPPQASVSSDDAVPASEHLAPGAGDAGMAPASPGAQVDV